MCVLCVWKKGGREGGRERERERERGMEEKKNKQCETLLKEYTAKKKSLLTIDKEEEGSGLVSHSSSNEGFPCARRTIQQNATGRFDSDGSEQLGVTQR